MIFINLKISTLIWMIVTFVTLVLQVYIAKPHDSTAPYNWVLLVLVRAIFSIYFFASLSICFYGQLSSSGLLKVLSTAGFFLATLSLFGAGAWYCIVQIGGTPLGYILVTLLWLGFGYWGITWSS